MNIAIVDVLQMHRSLIFGKRASDANISEIENRQAFKILGSRMPYWRKQPCCIVVPAVLAMGSFWAAPLGLFGLYAAELKDLVLVKYCLCVFYLFIACVTLDRMLGDERILYLGNRLSSTVAYVGSHMFNYW